MRRLSGYRAAAAVAFCLTAWTLTPAGLHAQTVPGDSPDAGSLFQIRTEPVAGGAELLTVFGRPDAGLAGEREDMPLVSVLRDTLGDDDGDNDRLRYVWVHGYASPSAPQRVASAVPFLNRRTGNKKPARATSAPRPVLDLAAPDRHLWRDIMWVAAQSMFFDPYGALAKTSVRAFRRNDDDYRKAHIVRALAVLSLYEADTGVEPVLTPVEMHDIQARLVLAQKTLGGLVNDAYLQRAYERDTASTADLRGHNWELLRQRAEADGPKRPFDSRFLNIKSPWGDKRLREWNGYTEERTLDADHRFVEKGTPGAHDVQLIPLALYGLDHPKIPVVLVDFRDHGNPKRREVSRRVLNDITRNVLSLSRYGDIHYFLGRTVYDFVTGRRGMDINQPSRLRSYSQLKLLLALTSTMAPALAEETSDLLERVSMNPLQNDTDVEIELAYRSYAALRAAVHSPSAAIARQLESDRRAEFRRLEHGRTARAFLRLATVATAGIYRHRETDPLPAQLAAVDRSRRIAFHRRFLEEVVDSTPVIEVVWNVDRVRRSLEYLAEHGGAGDGSSVKLALATFERTSDHAIQRVALGWLARGGTEAATNALVRIERSPDIAPDIRALGTRYLNGIRAASSSPLPASARVATDD